MVSWAMTFPRRGDSRANPGTAFVDSPAAVASDADVVITSLPGPAEVQDVVYGAHGLLASMKPAAVLVETSTISPQQSRTLAKDFSARNVAYLDAPISGGVQGARDGTLVAMVGGATEVLDIVRPVLCCFRQGNLSSWAGGSGQRDEARYPIDLLAQMAGFLEAVSMGERSGIALDTLLRIIAASSAHHPAIGTRYEKLRSGNLDPMFEVASAVKDLSLAEDIWRELDGPYPTLVRAFRLQGCSGRGLCRGRPHRSSKLAWAAKYLISATDFWSAA